MADLLKWLGGAAKNVEHAIGTGVRDVVHAGQAVVNNPVVQRAASDVANVGQAVTNPMGFASNKAAQQTASYVTNPASIKQLPAIAVKAPQTAYNTLVKPIVKNVQNVSTDVQQGNPWTGTTYQNQDIANKLLAQLDATDAATQAQLKAGKITAPRFKQLTQDTNKSRSDIIKALDKQVSTYRTPGQAIGDVGQLGANLVSTGTGGAAATEGAGLTGAIVRGALPNAGYGAASGGLTALSNKGSAKDIIKSVLAGGAQGAALGGVLGGAGYGAAKLGITAAPHINNERGSVGLNEPLKSPGLPNEANPQVLSELSTNSLLQDASSAKPGHLDYLKGAIENGTAKPIEVRQMPDGSLFVNDGRHTLEAARQLGIDNYPIKDVTAQYAQPRDVMGRFDKLKAMVSNEQGGVKFNEPLKPGQDANAKQVVDTLAKERADMLRSIHDDTGGVSLVKNADGQVTGRLSSNDPFYSQYYKENGRPPTKAAWLAEAHRQLSTDTTEEGVMYRDAGAALNSKPSAQTSNTPVIPKKVGRQVTPFTAEVQQTLDKASQDVGPAGKSTGAAHEMASWFNPVRGPEGQVIKNDLRASVGSLELQKGMTANATKDMVKFWDKQAPGDNLSFIQKVESGTPQATPELQKLAQGFREWFNKDYELATQIKPETPFVQDYFAHSGIWKDPKAAEQFYNKWSSPTLGGKPGALEHRTFPTIYDGIKAGLGIKDANPQVIANANRASLMRAKMAQDFLSQEQTKGMNPADVQAVLDRYLGRGFRDSSVYQSARQVGNTLNQAQLSLSGFHVGGTAINSVLSRFSNGLNDITRAHPIKGLGEIATSPVAPLIDVLKGGRILKDFHNNNITPEIQDIVEGGGRIGQPVNYKATGLSQSLKDIQSGHPIKGIVTAPLRALSATAKPVMEMWVPRLKLGATSATIHSKLASLPADASPDMIRAAKAEAVDSIDNRFGQLIQDNLFWDQHLKDTMHILMRSPGWNIGTVREVGGGIANLAKPSTYKGLAQGRGLPESTSYTLSLAAGTMLMGGTLQYLYTGKWPQEAKDYFYPRTGKTDKNGNPERVSLPTYAKDVFSFLHDPVQTAKNKANPFISEVMQLNSNKDYFGNQIHNPADSPGTQAKQVAGYALKSNLPFTLTNSGKRVDNNLSTTLQTTFGINPAPGYITKSGFEQATQLALNHALGSKSLTPEEQALITAKSQAKTAQQGGDSTLIDQLVTDGKISQKQADNLKVSASQNSLQNTFNYLVKADRPAAAKAIQDASAQDIAHLGDTTQLQKDLAKSIVDGKANPQSIQAAKDILAKLGVSESDQVTLAAQKKADIAAKVKAAHPPKPRTTKTKTTKTSGRRVAKVKIPTIKAASFKTPSFRTTMKAPKYSVKALPKYKAPKIPRAPKVKKTA